MIRDVSSRWVERRWIARAPEHAFEFGETRLQARRLGVEAAQQSPIASLGQLAHAGVAVAHGEAVQQSQVGQLPAGLATDVDLGALERVLERGLGGGLGLGASAGQTFQQHRMRVLLAEVDVQLSMRQ